MLSTAKGFCLRIVVKSPTFILACIISGEVGIRNIAVVAMRRTEIVRRLFCQAFVRATCDIFQVVFQKELVPRNGKC